MPKKLFLLLVIFALGAAPSRGIGRDGQDDAMTPPASGGLGLVDRSLKQLSGHRRLLVVGAHPDDEDNALLSHVSHGLGGEVAYLSLSRGEGGQNLIGSELGTDLGVIRTGELLAARAVEGGRQYFARAFDFGYTRSLDETFARWPREILQRDAVRVARRFRPQVVVAVFPATGRGGHGQHQASAVIAGDLFDLSGDSEAFAGLAAEGLAPWTPEVLYRRAWDQSEATVSYELGTLEELSGRSLAQLAAASRSLHRSQDMGRLQRLGSFRGGLVWLAGGKGPGATSIFDGIDTRLAAMAATVDDPGSRRRLEEILDAVESVARETRSQLTPGGLNEAAHSLADIVRRLAEAQQITEKIGERPAAELVAEKKQIAERALLTAAGVVLDARVENEDLVVGSRALVEAEVWSAASHDVEVHNVAMVTTGPWQAGAMIEVTDDTASSVRRWEGSIEVPAQSAPSFPYFLDQPRAGDLYNWDDAPAAVKGQPFARPPLLVNFSLAVDGVVVEVEREAVYRYADQAVGEIRRPVRAVPRLEIELGTDLLLWRRGVTPEAVIEVIVRSNVDEPLTGRLDAEAPEGWSVEGDLEFSIERKRGTVRRTVRIVPVSTPESGRFSLAFRARVGDEVFDRAYPVLEYPHIRPRVSPREARVALSVFDLELPEDLEVGYVVGASDRIPGVLRSLGVELTALAGGDLSVGDLGSFDVIVVGSRAYETDEELRRSNGRLLEYVRGGGVLVVQYQQYQFVQGGFAALELEIARPHGRVTDERAPVEMLEPRHPLLSWPNEIAEADWEGWVQERGLYFPHAWDERYRPLLAMRDEGRDEERGALLAAEYGDGLYIYSGLSFFRQLPAGVPGALRLFANLLAARAAPEEVLR